MKIINILLVLIIFSSCHQKNNIKETNVNYSKGICDNKSFWIDKNRKTMFLISCDKKFVKFEFNQIDKCWKLYDREDIVGVDIINWRIKENVIIGKNGLSDFLHDTIYSFTEDSLIIYDCSVPVIKELTKVSLSNLFFCELPEEVNDLINR